MKEDELRALLGRNAALTARAKRHAGVIHDKAVEALDAAHNRLSGISPADAVLDEAKGAEYRHAIIERGKLSSLVGSTSS